MGDEAEELSRPNSPSGADDMKKFLKIVGLLFLVLILVIIALMAISTTRKSGYSNCVVAASAASFTGKNLKYDGAAERKTLKTEECVGSDQKLDGADGPQKGRVRWVECSVGPDCDEAGMN
jgi:hypothetical protein